MAPLKNKKNNRRIKKKLEIAGHSWQEKKIEKANMFQCKSKIMWECKYLVLLRFMVSANKKIFADLLLLSTFFMTLAAGAHHKFSAGNLF